MPIKANRKKTKTLVVGGSSEQIGEHRGRVSLGLLRCKALWSESQWNLEERGFGISQSRTNRNGNCTEPWKHVSWNYLVDSHSSKCIPEGSELPRGLKTLPVKILQRFHNWKVGPVNAFGMPYSDWPLDSGDAISEEADGDH